MPKTKQQKELMLQRLKQQLDQLKAGVFATFSKITVQEQEGLRQQLREAGVSFNVCKKSLLKRVLQERGFSLAGLDGWLGNIGLASSLEDEIAPAKILARVSQDLAGLEIKDGILEGKIIVFEQVQALAKLPSKDELIAKVVSSIRAPLAGLVNVLEGNQRNLLNVLNQIINHKT